MAKIDELREHLFETLKALRDPENPMEIDRAKAICDVGQVIINSAKVEVDAMRATGGKFGSGFLPEPEKSIPGHAERADVTPIDPQRRLRQTMRDRA